MGEIQSNNKTRIWLALIALYVAWGTTYLAIRIAVESIPPFLMAGTRFLIAGLIVYIWRRMAGDPPPTRRQWVSAAIIGLLLLLGGNGGLTWAEQRIPSGIAALLVASIPFWMVLVDALRPGGKLPNAQTIGGILLGMVGIAILISPDQAQVNGEGLDAAGVAVLLLASLLWSVGSVYGRSADLPKSALLGTGMEMLAGSAGLFLAGIAAGEWRGLELAEISAGSLLALAYLVVFGSLVGFVAYSWLLRVAPTPLVSTYAYVNPLIAVLLGSALAQEVLTPRVLLATPVILSAVALINFVRIRTAKPAPVAGSTVMVVTRKG